MEAKGSMIKEIKKSYQLSTYFPKGTIMKSSIKNSKLAFLVSLALLMFTCAVSFAENENQAENEVLTTLEQRMLKRITVDFRDTPIDDVIRAMAEQADVDIIKSPKVTGNVTTTLTNVPLGEALTSILAAHGYSYVATKNIIRVAPVGEISEETERLVDRIYRLNYANVTEVEKALKKFISSRGSLSSNSGTSNIIVTDTETKIKAVDTFIQEIDRITPQILVEARIYDITSKDRLDLGIEWAAGRNTTLTSGIGNNPTSGRTNPFITGDFSGKTSNVESSAGTLRLGWLNSSVDIDVILRAQQQNICAKLLANPRVLVLDNETALFKIVSEIPYIEISETSGGGSIGSTKFREVGVELEVTPHFTRDEMIRLQLKPKFSVQTSTVTVTGAGAGSYPQPVVDRREANTTLLIKNGQTVVLGGLRKKEATLQTNKIPLLGDIPLLGSLFKFEGEDIVTSELVVFITPRIVEKPVMSNREMVNFEATEFCEPNCPSAKIGPCSKK